MAYYYTMTEVEWLYYKPVFGNRKNLIRYIAEIADRDRREWMFRTGQHDHM